MAEEAEVGYPGGPVKCAHTQQTRCFSRKDIALPTLCLSEAHPTQTTSLSWLGVSPARKREKPLPTGFG